MFRVMIMSAVLLLTQSAVGDLSPPQRSYNILMLLPCSSKSHQNVFMPLATALATRGHKITMLTDNPVTDQNPNISCIEHGINYFLESTSNMFEIRKDPNKMFEMFEDMFPKIARELYDVPAVKELYKKRASFDLMILNSMFNEVAYPFLYKQTFIMLTTSILDPSKSAIVGNLQNPAYVSNMMDDYPRPFSFINRVKNIFFSFMIPIKWNGSVRRPVEIELKNRFPDLPSFLDIEKNQSLMLINSHFSIGTSLPLLPSQVEVGGMHLRPAKPLPKDILEFVSSQTPVVYMSLGSVVKSSTMPKHYRDIILAAFAKLPYKFIWKFEDQFDNLPKNIIIKKWMPQQDILAHPNVKLFISHCGMLSSQEAMYHSTPMLGLPIFGDQPKNAKHLENIGVALSLEWDDLSEQLIIDTITELIKNPSYLEKMQQISATFRDQPEKPVERAVFWTEYVIRHKGAEHLRSPELSLSWVELLHLDIILVAILVVYLLYRIIKKLCGLCFGSSTRNKSSKKTKNKRD